MWLTRIYERFMLFLSLPKQKGQNYNAFIYQISKSSVPWNLKAPCLIMSLNKNFNSRTINLGIADIFENVSNYL